MESLISILLIASISLVAFSLIVLCAFAVYIAVLKYRKLHKKPKRLIIPKERINYDDYVSVKTRPIPVALEEPFYMNDEEFKMPSRSRVRKKSVSSISVDELDVSSYSSADVPGTETDETEPVDNRPSLMVSFAYNVSLLELNIGVIRGKDFSEEDDSDSHIIVSVVLLPEGSISHSSRGVPPNPLFKDKFVFPVTADEMKASRVKFNVWKIDKYSRKCPVGEIVVRMQEIFQGNDSSYSSKFEIWSELVLTDKLTNETANGELLTSLQYLPSAERVNVTVMKGRDLKIEEFDKDIYVKVSAVVNGKVVKNKKTSVMRKTRMPLFNETTSFELQPHSNLTLQNMTVILSVYAYRSRGPHRRLIGRAVIGEGDISNKEVKHWRMMVEAPRKMIAEWQDLK